MEKSDKKINPFDGFDKLTVVSPSNHKLRINAEQGRSIKHFEGVVVSDKMAKTVVVRVEKYEKHPRYGRYMKASKKYKAHDEKGEYHTGDKVVIAETKPISKDKHFTVISKIK